MADFDPNPRRGLVGYAVEHRVLGTIAMTVLGFVLGLYIGWQGYGTGSLDQGLVVGAAFAILFGYAGFSAPRAARRRRGDQS